MGNGALKSLCREHERMLLIYRIDGTRLDKLFSLIFTFITNYKLTTRCKYPENSVPPLYIQAKRFEALPSGQILLHEQRQLQI